jgi:hypothetical protein
VAEVSKGPGEVLEVFGKTPIPSEPGKGTLHHPAARQYDEAPHVVAPLDDLPVQQRHLRDGRLHLPGMVPNKEGGGGR